MGNLVTDKIGKNTLDVIGEADKFNKWMYETILPFTKGRILEIGSGLGNISNFFLENNKEIFLTDLRTEYCTLLQDKFSSKPNLLGIDQLNLIHPDFDQVYNDHLEKFDTVFALNVIEHIKDDNLAISNCKKLLKDNGHLIILVPSYQKLFNRFDEELGHFQRYNLNSLHKLFSRNHLSVVHKQYFNLIGIAGWYISGSLMKKESIPSKQMKIYNKLVPVWQVLDMMVQNKIGLSTIVVGRK
ncbi:MAG: methyltransferase [Gillisia sp.]